MLQTSTSTFTILASAAFTVFATMTNAADVTIRLDLDGRRIEGNPVAWSDAGVMLMGRDGHLWQFQSDEPTNFQQIGDSFRSYSQSEMRGQLQREFGDRFEVSGTGHYLVVHPKGQRDLWAERFEQLYRQFVHYFTARGFHIQPPQFPMVAVVFHNQQDFARFAARDGVNVNRGVLGYYSPTTNRVLLFDVNAGQSGGDWTTNADTIIHEATHQTAFNTGIHTRLAPQPKWAAEGLATMFEAPGVWHSDAHRTLADRVNRYRLERFRERAAAGRRRGTTEQLIASDRMFETDADAAYAESWALSFYLAEREPRKYAEILAKLAARPPLKGYTTARRLADFRSIFGEDLAMLEVRMLRFIEGLE